MKIIRTSNFGSDSVSDILYRCNVTSAEAKSMVKRLNKDVTENSTYCFAAVKDDYKLCQGMWDHYGYDKIVHIDGRDDNGNTIYQTQEFGLNPGITTLIGCNGSGKSTWIKEMIKQLNKDKVPYWSYQAINQSGNVVRDAMSQASNANDLDSVALAKFSSEGESMFNNFGFYLKSLGRFISKECKDANEAWVFLDSFDSGMSIDNIEEFKKFLIETFLPTCREDLDVYVIIAANDYNLQQSFRALAVQTGEYMQFTDYEAYESFILWSRKLKDKRYK